MVRKNLFKITAVRERLSQLGRETELSSQYGQDSWGFVANKKSEENSEGKLQSGTSLDIKGRDYY